MPSRLLRWRALCSCLTPRRKSGLVMHNKEMSSGKSMLSRFWRCRLMPLYLCNSCMHVVCMAARLRGSDFMLQTARPWPFLLQPACMPASEAKHTDQQSRWDGTSDIHRALSLLNTSRGRTACPPSPAIASADQTHRITNSSRLPVRGQFGNIRHARFSSGGHDHLPATPLMMSEAALGSSEHTGL